MWNHTGLWVNRVNFGNNQGQWEKGIAELFNKSLHNILLSWFKNLNVVTEQFIWKNSCKMPFVLATGCEATKAYNCLFSFLSNTDPLARPGKISADYPTERITYTKDLHKINWNIKKTTCVGHRDSLSSSNDNLPFVWILYIYIYITSARD